MLLALGAAEAGARLLAPREPPIVPAPVDLSQHFSPAEIARGRTFARPQLALSLIRSGIEAGVLAALARRPPRFTERIQNPVLGAAATGAGLSLVMATAPLPVSALSRRRALAAGLATQSWGGWAADVAKSDGIGAGLAAGAGAAVIATMRRYPRSWWIPMAGGSVGVGALLAAIAPVILDPIFNDFTPLPTGLTRDDVLTLAREAGVEVGEVYSVDASRRTTAANAYVTGLGPTKRVVLFDTLLDRYGRDEIRVVVAHELAHVRGRDVARGILYAAIVAPAGALAVARLSRGFPAAGPTPAALPALALAAGIVSLPLGLIGNRLSRALERRADAVSLQLTGAAEAFVSFERTIALQNIADLEPPRWVTALLSTHPSTGERIGAALSYANQAGR
jgi:STE24 endopeptidase